MKLTIIILGLFFIMDSCEKIDVAKGTPTCIIKRIERDKDKCLDTVYKYSYQGEEVYLFVDATCQDAASTLYDSNCEYICILEGGIAGLGNCDTNFFTKAINRKLIWSK